MSNHTDPTVHLNGTSRESLVQHSLVEAINQADPQSLRGLRDIVGYCYWEIPSPCWGSPAKIEAWLEQGSEKSDD